MEQIAQQLPHLPQHKIAELETITRQIIETGMACMVILYGSYARGNWKEVPGKNKWFFNPEFRTGKKSDYDLLVLAKDERDSQDLKNRLYKMFDHAPTAVQATVETLGFVNMHLREGQYFFTEIKEQGIILYADDHVKLAEAENLTPDRLREIAERDFKHWFGTANTAFKYAKYGIRDNDYKKAAFELQQAVEHCYTVIEMVFSRNNPYEHRLSVLRMNAQRYVPEAASCFPQNTEEEKGLFSHLDAAYIGGRYIDEEHYRVSKEQLEYWEKETKKLLELTKKACLAKIEELT